MFSYFGSKSKLAHLYPKPKHGLIIEPFAGSARYSLLHWENEVILNDINPTIVRIWAYLLAASKQDILGLPDIKIGESVYDYHYLSEPERDLIGFELCRGKAIPRKVISKFSNWVAARERIANNIHKIKHWRISCLSYNSVLCNAFSCGVNQATWFIDPPYILDKATGMSYKYNHINYETLAEYCKTRNGQTIVCAGTNDEWLPFTTLRAVWNGGKIGKEKVWINEN